MVLYYAPMRKPSRISPFLLAAFLAAGVLTGLFTGLLAAVTQDLPQIQALEDFEPSAATRILAADGRTLGELYVHRRLPLTLEEMPRELRQAVLAVEDRRFYSHPGVDVIRAGGALLRDIKAGGFVEGASTITQQLARNLFLTPRKTVLRKLREIFLALQIERSYTKDEILRFYLNQIYLGSGAYGVAAAAETYFGKRASELTLGECAVLAGIPKSPARYAPTGDLKEALTRRRVVLSAMVRENFITDAQAAKAAAEPLRPLPRRQPKTLAPYYVEQVRRLLLDKFSENMVYKGGLEVRTTLDMTLQKAAEQALQKGLADLDGERAGSSSLSETAQGALVALEAATGRVLAWVGGSDYESNPFDRVEQARRQPGSAFKPLVYATAIEGGLTQTDLVWDAPVSYQVEGSREPWRPQNFSHRFEGETTLRRALEVSGNVPAIKLLARVGVDNVITTARKLGVTSTLNPNLSLALGTSEVSLLELTGAYNGLASGGLWPEPYLIEEVRDRSGRVLLKSRPQRLVALTPETAYIVTDMLKGVVEDGTAQRARVLNAPLAGKTGTTDDYRDALFVGYSPRVAAGVWVGLDSHGSLGRGMTGARAALPIWMDFMRTVLTERPAVEFTRPVNVVMQPVDRFTGRAAGPDDPNAVSAAFRTGTQPRNSPPGP